MEIGSITNYLIAEGRRVRDAYLPGVENRLDYVCIFCQSEDEFTSFNEQAASVAKPSLKTSTGIVYTFDEKFPDEYGTKLLKIRTVDPERPQRGDVDYCLNSYETIKQILLELPGTQLISRPNIEMIELVDDSTDVLLYFSNPPLSKELGVEY